MKANYEPPFNHDLFPQVRDDPVTYTIVTDRLGFDPERASLSMLHMVLEWLDFTGSYLHHTKEGDTAYEPGHEAPRQVFDRSGETGTVLLLDSPSPIAVKVRTHYNDTTLFEALFLRALAPHKPQSPVEIPNYIRYKAPGDAMLQQLWETRVGGVKLSDDEIRHFSSTEKHDLGRKLGKWAAWLANAISLKEYGEILERAGSPELFDRADLMRDFSGGVQALGESRRFRSVQDREFTDFTLRGEDAMYLPLADTIRWLESEYQRLEVGGRLNASIVGHDDLRIDNLTFKPDDNGYSLEAVIDFALVRPMSAERELRHLVPYGQEIVDPAIEAYESDTGQSLDREVLNFWSIGQIATQAAVQTLNLPNSLPQLRKLKPALEDLLPKQDWSGLVAASAEATTTSDRARHETTNLSRSSVLPAPLRDN